MLEALFRQSEAFGCLEKSCINSLGLLSCVLIFEPALLLPQMLNQSIADFFLLFQRLLSFSLFILRFLFGTFHCFLD